MMKDLDDDPLPLRGGSAHRAVAGASAQKAQELCGTLCVAIVT